MKVDRTYYDDVNVILPLIFNWSITSLIDVIESNNVLDNYPFKTEGFSVLQILKGSEDEFRQQDRDIPFQGSSDTDEGNIIIVITCIFQLVEN